MPTITNFLTAREIAGALDRGRKSGTGYVACCPAHPDRTPSLSLRDGADGRVLVHCHTGCSQEAVIDALRSKGLWPVRERRWLSEAEFEEQRRIAREQEREDQEVWFPAIREFIRELEDRRDELIRALRIKDDFYLEVELEVCYSRIDALRKSIGDDVSEEAVALTIAIVNLIAEKQANET